MSVGLNRKLAMDDMAAPGVFHQQVRDPVLVNGSENREVAVVVVESEADGCGLELEVEAARAELPPLPDGESMLEDVDSIEELGSVEELDLADVDSLEDLAITRRPRTGSESISVPPTISVTELCDSLQSNTPSDESLPSPPAMEEQGVEVEGQDENVEVEDFYIPTTRDFAYEKIDGSKLHQWTEEEMREIMRERDLERVPRRRFSAGNLREVWGAFGVGTEGRWGDLPSSDVDEEEAVSLNASWNARGSVWGAFGVGTRWAGLPSEDTDEEDEESGQGWTMFNFGDQAREDRLKEKAKEKGGEKKKEKENKKEKSIRPRFKRTDGSLYVFRRQEDKTVDKAGSPDEFFPCSSHSLKQESDMVGEQLKDEVEEEFYSAEEMLPGSSAKPPEKRNKKSSGSLNLANRGVKRSLNQGELIKVKASYCPPPKMGRLYILPESNPEALPSQDRQAKILHKTTLMAMLTQPGLSRYYHNERKKSTGASFLDSPSVISTPEVMKNLLDGKPSSNLLSITEAPTNAEILPELPLHPLSPLAHQREEIESIMPPTPPKTLSSTPPRIMPSTPPRVIPSTPSNLISPSLSTTPESLDERLSTAFGIPNRSYRQLQPHLSPTSFLLLSDDEEPDEFDLTIPPLRNGPWIPPRRSSIRYPQNTSLNEAVPSSRNLHDHALGVPARSHRRPRRPIATDFLRLTDSDSDTPPTCVGRSLGPIMEVPPERERSSYLFTMEDSDEHLQDLIANRVSIDTPDFPNGVICPLANNNTNRHEIIFQMTTSEERHPLPLAPPPPQPVKRLAKSPSYPFPRMVNHASSAKGKAKEKGKGNESSTTVVSAGMRSGKGLTGGRASEDMVKDGNGKRSSIGKRTSGWKELPRKIWGRRRSGREGGEGGG